MRLRLIIEIDAIRPKDAKDLAAVVSDYADEQFEVMTTERGRPMSMHSWEEKPRARRAEQKAQVVIAPRDEIGENQRGEG